jgi:hypothetical protein
MSSDFPSIVSFRRNWALRLFLYWVFFFTWIQAATAAIVPTVPSVADAEIKAQVALGDSGLLEKWTEQELSAHYARLSDRKILLQDGARVRLILLHRFLNSFEPAEIKEVLSTKDGQAFLLELCCDDRLLKGCFGRPPTGKARRVWPAGALRDWVGIWKNLGMEERRKRGMLAAACSFALAGKGIKDPLGRRLVAREVYAWFKKSDEGSSLAVNLGSLTLEELCILATVPRSAEEMDYMRRTTLLKNARWETLHKNAYRVPYNLFNEEGVSIHNPKFYKGNPGTLEVLERMGGVCGATSAFGEAACRARGVPASWVGQPGHCAFMWLNKEFKWVLGNDNHGWKGSHGGPGLRLLSPWMAEGNWIRVVEALRLKEACLQAELYMEAASMLDAQERLWCLQNAVKVSPEHPTPWRLLLEALPEQERPAVSKSARLAMSSYPPEIFAWVVAIEDLTQK